MNMYPFFVAKKAQKAYYKGKPMFSISKKNTPIAPFKVSYRARPEPVEEGYSSAKIMHNFVNPAIILIFLTSCAINYTSEPPLFIQKYSNSLPRLNNHENEPLLPKELQAKDITNYLCKFIPQKKSLTIQGSDTLSDKLCTLMKNGKPISLLILGFPFKSTNHEKKCLSSNVDAGEYLSLITLNSIVHNIQSIYPQTNCTIISDGLAYHIDDYDYSYENIFHYHETMTELTENFPNLSFVSWKINDTLTSYKDLQHEVSTIPSVLNTADTERYNEMSSFVAGEFDSTYWQNIFLKQAEEQYAIELKNLKPKLKKQEISTIKNKLITEKSKSIAIDLVSKGKQFAAFVSQAWPNYSDCIRLSVHCEKNIADISNKIPISLIYGHFGTPWHNSVVIDDKKNEISGFFKDIFKNKKDSLANKKLEHLNIETKNGKTISLQYIIK